MRATAKTVSKISQCPKCHHPPRVILGITDNDFTILLLRRRKWLLAPDLREVTTSFFFSRFGRMQGQDPFIAFFLRPSYLPILAPNSRWSARRYWSAVWSWGLPDVFKDPKNRPLFCRFSKSVLCCIAIKFYTLIPQLTRFQCAQKRTQSGGDRSNSLAPFSERWTQDIPREKLGPILIGLSTKVGIGKFSLFSPLLPPHFQYLLYGANNKGNCGGGDTCDDIEEGREIIVSDAARETLPSTRFFSTHTSISHPRVKTNLFGRLLFFLFFLRRIFFHCAEKIWWRRIPNSVMAAWWCPWWWWWAPPPPITQTVDSRNRTKKKRGKKNEEKGVL